MDSPDRRVLRFQTTAKASADARALSTVRLSQLEVIVGFVVLVYGLSILAVGVSAGILVAVVAGLGLIDSRQHLLLRALVAIHFRSILARTTEVAMDDDGLHYKNPLGSSFVPWSSMTTIRQNSRTVGFFRGHVLLGYIPSVAFDSPEARVAVVAFAQTRIKGGS
jgi:hypothetical protein